MHVYPTVAATWVTEALKLAQEPATISPLSQSTAGLVRHQNVGLSSGWTFIQSVWLIGGRDYLHMYMYSHLSHGEELLYLQRWHRRCQWAPAWPRLSWWKFAWRYVESTEVNCLISSEVEMDSTDQLEVKTCSFYTFSLSIMFSNFFRIGHEDTAFGHLSTSGFETTDKFPKFVLRSRGIVCLLLLSFSFSGSWACDFVLMRYFPLTNAFQLSSCRYLVSTNCSGDLKLPRQRTRLDGRWYAPAWAEHKSSEVKLKSH